MTTFLLDLWQDLRAKRLWPVAVALLAATVAVPVMLSKPASSTNPTAAAGQASTTAKLPTVSLDASSIASSHLNIFKQKNPFASLKDPDATQGAAVTAGTTASTPTGTTVSGPTGSASTALTGGSTTSSSTGSTGGTTPTGPTGKPVTPGVHYFTYTADVQFGLRGKVKAYKGLKELDVLPSGSNPIVAFMGVKDGKTAVFFIADPAFRADGEGKCQPSPDNCMFVSLTKDAAQDEETLSAQNGQIEYVLKLTGLHVQTLSKSQVVGSTTPDKSGAQPARKRRARAKRRATLLTMPAVLAKR